MVQAPERLPDIIVDFCDVGPMEHHDAGLTYFQYIAKRYGERGLGLVPDLALALAVAESDDPDIRAGAFGDPVVDALVDSGAWKAKCLRCRTAIMVCHHVPYFMCVGCGNTEFGRQWLRLAFPQDRAALEAALLTIPGFRTSAPDRWYQPGTPIPEPSKEVA